MKLFPRAALDELAVKASASPRLRSHLNVHAAPTDLVQRFFVVANTDSYFRPHRHLTKSELALVLRGEFEVITFDDSGVIVGRYEVGEKTPTLGYETPRAVWHTLIARNDGSAFFEVKEGPYDPASAAEFAPWAPAEGDASAVAFMRWIRTAPVGARAPVF